MENKIKIVSDGAAIGTKVFAFGADGNHIELTGISRIELLPIEPGSSLKAKLTFINVEVDIISEKAD